MLHLPSALGLVSLQNCKKSIPVHRPLVYDYHACLVAQSCLTLCNTMHCSPWGSSVQGRVPWSGLPLPFLGDLPDPGAKPVSPVSLALQADSLPAEPSEKSTCMPASRFSHVWLFVTPWTVAHQAPPSMGFSRQEYWNGLPCPFPWCKPLSLPYFC